MNNDERIQSNQTNNDKSYTDPTLAEDTLFDEGEFILPQKPVIITILGKPGTGKTYLIKSLIYISQSCEPNISSTNLR
jgi:AAA15 family ATPase/GTPase